MGLGRDIMAAIHTNTPAAVSLYKNTATMVASVAPTVFILELNIVAHQVPPFVVSGNMLFAWFLSILNQYIYCPRSQINTVVLVADNYRLVPPEKRVVQAARQSRHAPPTPEMLAAGVTDTVCPSGAHINASSQLIHAVIEYLLHRAAVLYADAENIAVYASCPSRKLPTVDDHIMLNGVRALPGANVRLSRCGNPAPPPFADGEGEIIGWLWARYLSAPVLFRSIDTDNAAIGMLMPPEVTNSVVVELKPVTIDKVAHRRALVTSALGTDVDQLLLYILGGGSDYCYGINGVTPIPGNGLRTLLKRVRTAAVQQPLTVRDHAGLIDVGPGFSKLMRSFLSAAQTDELAPVFARAFWNLNYWGQILPRNQHLFPSPVHSESHMCTQ